MNREDFPRVVRADVLSGRVPESDLAWAETMLESGYGGRMMYVPLAGWYLWTGKMWAKDAEGKGAAKLAHEFARMYREAPYGEKDPDLQKKLVGMVRAAEGAVHVAKVLSVLSSYTAVGVEELDRDAWLLNTPDGILDLKSREIYKHDPDRKMTMMTRGVWDPDLLRGSRFKQIIEQIVPDAGRRGYLQEMCGLALVGEQLEQIALLLYGPTARNGKSTVGETLSAALGGYAETGDPAILTAADKHPENLAALHRKRMVQFSELPEDKILAVAGFKRLTGDDTVSARFLFKDRFSYRPAFMMMIRANDLPYVPGDDEGTWRRIRVILFEVVFSGAGDDRGLRRALASKSEASAALTWMIEGLARYLGRDERERYREPDVVTRDTQELRDTHDPVGQFWRERICVVADEQKSFISYNDIWMAYTAWWALQSGKPGLSQAALTRKLRKKPGLMHAKTREGTRGVGGVKLTESRMWRNGAKTDVTGG